MHSNTGKIEMSEHFSSQLSKPQDEQKGINREFSSENESRGQGML